MAPDAHDHILFEQIAHEFHPVKIVLFGSRARGTARDDSDMDLLVVMEHHGPAYETAARIRARLPASRAFDILVRRPADLEEAHQLGDPMIRRAIREGVVVYQAAA